MNMKLWSVAFAVVVWGAGFIFSTPVRADEGLWATTGFSYGNTTSNPDGFTGCPGDGWTDAWQKLNWTDFGTGTDSGQVLQLGSYGYRPLYSGGGSYLNLHVAAGTDEGRMGVGRSCSEVELNPSLSYTVDFYCRIEDELESFDADYDRFQFMGATYYRSTSAANCSWIVGAYGVNSGQVSDGNVYWMLYDGLGDDNWYDSRQVNSNLAVMEDVTYKFSVTVNPMERNYSATITNLSTSASYTTPTALGWRASAASYPTGDFDGRIMAGARVEAGETLDWSIDGVSVTGQPPVFEPAPADGFKGIWYSINDLGEPYHYKYSGGLGTYTHQIRPIAQYSEAANKTFFVYGGTNSENSTLYNCISYYDHTTGQVARPRILVDKLTTDAHDNASMILDSDGYIYTFLNAHGTTRPSYIMRSTSPYSIDEFETVLALPTDTNFSYAQPLYVAGQGFFLFHTHYNDYGRTLFYNTSSDGINWDYEWGSQPAISQINGGQYQVSNVCGQKVGTAFNHLINKAADTRSNLYYMESGNMGQTWTTADGTLLTTPLTNVTNDALIHDYRSEGLYVYLKDIQYDAEGQPVIMYLTSDEWEPGPSGDPHQFHIAHFNDGAWEIKDLFTVDHNYDYGQLTIEEDGSWLIVAPTIDGPQVYATGGEMATWVSDDEGDTWRMIRQLTYDSEYNHSYPRVPVDVNDDFYALWADGDAYGLSESCLYFTDKDGTGVWKLPYEMDTDFATPELVYTPIDTSLPGDANNDGYVDGSDATILAGYWQQTNATWSMGDFNGDDVVDGSDATILAGYWQQGTPPQATTVPEPATWTLLLVLAGVFLAAELARRFLADGPARRFF